jgi:hypothetical protein
MLSYIPAQAKDEQPRRAQETFRRFVKELGQPLSPSIIFPLHRCRRSRRRHGRSAKAIDTFPSHSQTHLKLISPDRTSLYFYFILKPRPRVSPPNLVKTPKIPTPNSSQCSNRGNVLYNAKSIYNSLPHLPRLCLFIACCRQRGIHTLQSISYKSGRRREGV